MERQAERRRGGSRPLEPPGDGIPGADRRRRAGGYRVGILYAEPEFRRRNPHTPDFFTSLFHCPGAASQEEALRMAMAEWDFCLRFSGVSWQRVIKSITIEPRETRRRSSERAARVDPSTGSE